ncbi:MAG TPA: HAD family phosphatase [Candidatus Limnocylindria bacterium]|nr:HAD family phosphatase [Candidatus Limnocylindria bacterium]
MSVLRDDAGNPRLQAVLFDMDGLLVDTEHAWFEAERRVMAELGGPWGDADALAMVGGPLTRVARYMVDLAGGGGDAARVEQLLVDTMADLLEAGADHRPGADDLLEDLVSAGVPCALVSSSPRVLVEAVLDSVGGDRFAFTIAGDEVERTKPFPDPYLAAVTRFGAAPARCIVLEDSPTGVAAGEAAGCVVVAVPFAVPIDPAPGRIVVGSLNELSADRLRSILED